MRNTKDPVVKKTKLAKGYTCVRWTPDLVFD